MCLHWRIFILVQGIGLALGAYGSCTVLEGLSATSSPGGYSAATLASLLRTSKQIPIQTSRCGAFHVISQLYGVSLAQQTFIAAEPLDKNQRLVP